MYHYAGLYFHVVRRNEVIYLDEWKKVVLSLLEIIVILSVGFLFTTYILRPIYENFGIQFTGDVWVNWFGLSYILFVLYSLIVGIFIFQESNIFKQRRTSVLFWLIFIGSIYVVFIPFIKGENPF